MRGNQVNWLPAFLIGLSVAVLVGLSIFNYRFSVQNPGGNDFLNHWLGIRELLLEGVSPYDESVSLKIQQMIYGHPADTTIGEDEFNMNYPLYSVVIIAPFSLLEFTTARALWMTVLEVSLVVLTLVSLRLVGWRVSSGMTVILMVFSIFWYHGTRTLILGQFAGVNALLISLALLLVYRKQDIPGGILLAFSTIKPNMVFLLIPFLLLWALSKRRYGIIFGTLGTLAILFVGSLALIPDWPLQWIRVLMRYPTYTEYIGIDSPLSYIGDLMPAISRTLNGVLHVGLGLYLLVEWFQAWGKDEHHMLWAAAMTMVVTNLIAYRTATTNYLMLLPVLFLVFRVWEFRWKRMGRVLVIFSLLGLLVGLWWLFAATVVGNQEAPVMYLPLPFICLFCLWWVRWWAIRPPRLFFDEFAARLN